jgi:transcription elongation factor Elf1
VGQISFARAERVAKGHACENCGEYSYKKLIVKPATLSQTKATGEAWHALKICGICGLECEMGIDDEGEIVALS